MKKGIVVLMWMLLLGAVGMIAAQTTTMPNAQKIKDRIQKQTDMINDGLKGHVMTKAEAKQYLAKLRVIKAKLQGYLKQNPKTDLTMDQMKVLYQMLHENNQAIQGEDPKDDKT